MKRRLFLLFALLTVLLLNSCEILPNDGDLIGTWNQINGSYQWIFYSDNTYDSTYNGGAYVGGNWRNVPEGISLNGNESIHYSIAGDILTFDHPYTNTNYQKQ